MESTEDDFCASCCKDGEVCSRCEDKDEYQSCESEEIVCKGCEDEVCTSCCENNKVVYKSEEECNDCKSEEECNDCKIEEDCNDCYRRDSSLEAISFNTYGSTNDEADFSNISKRSNLYIKPEQQRELAKVQYYRRLIQQQMIDYQKIRLEEECFEQELSSMKEYSNELDQTMEKVWAEAQETVEKNSLFRKTYNTLMDQEEPQVKRTAQYLRQNVPIRDELFDILRVTSQTEKYAVENAADLQKDYRRRIKELIQTRTRLHQKFRTFRQIFEKKSRTKEVGM